MALSKRLLALFLASFFLVSASAKAQDAPAIFPTEGLYEMLPAGPIVGDGETPVTLNVLMLKSDGTPLSGNVRFRVITSSGTATSLSEVGSGIFSFVYTPPMIRQPRQALLRLKGRSANGSAVNINWALDLLPPPSDRVTPSLNPARVILGQDMGASLSFEIPAFSDATGDPELLIRAASGEVTNVIHLGEGRFTGRYTPPKVVYPHTDLITVADARAPSQTYGAIAVPLVGKVGYPVQSAPNAMVILHVGDRPFGPYQTDANGRAVVPIEVDPGVSKGVLSTVVGGKTTEEPLDLKVPVTRRIALFPTHNALPGDGQAEIPIRAYVTSLTGVPDGDAAISFSATAGTMGEPKHLGEGVYEVLFTPPRMSASSEITLQASIQGEPGIQSDSMAVALVPLRAERVTLNADPPRLGATTSAFKVYSRVEDSQGVGLPGRNIQFNATGAKLHGGVKDLQSGDYQSTFTTTGKTGVDLTATVLPAPTGNAIHGVVVVTSRNRLPADNLSSSVITVLAVDAFGYPIPGVEVDLRVSGAGGTLPDSATTNSLGIQQIIYTAGGNPGLTTITARAGKFMGGAAIFLGSADLLPDLVIPASGTATTQQWSNSWAGSIAQLQVPREGAEGLGPIGTVTGGTSTVSQIDVVAQPGSAAPGGSVSLDIHAKNAEGRGLSGQQLAIMASQGEVGVLKELGGGRYQARISMPTDTKASTKIVVSTEDGATFQMLTIPLVEGAPTPEPEPEPEPIVEAIVEAIAPTSAAPDTASTATLPTPGADSDLPWLRIRGGWVTGTYDYTQTPAAFEDNPLYEDEVSLEGAPLQGGGLAIDAWLPQLPMVGAEFRSRVAVYGADWPGTDARVTDAVPHVSFAAKARYGFTEAGNHYYAAGRVGFQYGDFITYTYESPADKTAIAYGALPVSGASFGAELGAELPVLGAYLQASIQKGLRPSSGTDGFDLGGYSTAVNLEAGYDVQDGLLVVLGYQLINQEIEVALDKTLITIGDLSDTTRVFFLGVGYQM